MLRTIGNKWFNSCLVVILLISLCVFFMRNKEKPVAHIYLDMATLPTILQMVDIIKSDPKTPKIIAWQRFPIPPRALDKEAALLSKYNAIQIPLPPYEGEFFQIRHRIYSALRAYHKIHPDTQYVVHVNFQHIAPLLTPVFQAIPPDRIKHLHLYEDGMSNVVWSRPNLHKNNFIYIDQCPLNIKKFLSQQKHGSVDLMLSNQMIPNGYAFCLHKVFPTTYHISFLEKLKTEKDFEELYQFLNTATLKDINFWQLAQDLSEDEKEELYKFVKFDKNDYIQKTSRKEVYFFTLSYWERFEQTEAILKKVKETLIDPKHNDTNDFILFYKEHPWRKTFSYEKTIKNIYPDAQTLDPQTPFEILIIAGLVPDHVFGLTSSLYFSLPKENILLYIKGKNDSYLPFLQKLGLLTEKNTTTLDAYLLEK